MADAPDEFAGFAQAAAAAAPDEFAGFAPADASASAPAPAPDETAERVAGLGGRALIQGIGHLADLPGTLYDLSNRAGLSVENYTRNLLGLPPSSGGPVHDLPPVYSDAAQAGADKLGLPTPATAAERIGSKAVEALPSAALLPSAPIAAGVSAMLGGASSQTAAEYGAGPVGQTLAGLAGGSVVALPSALAAGTRAIVRGGAAGQAAMQGRIAAAGETNLTAGQAGGSPFVQYLEGLSSKGWGGGPINKASEAQTESLGAQVNRTIDNLSQGTTPSPTAAGNAINAGAETAKQDMRAAETAAFNKRDALVPPHTPTDVSGTLGTLDKLVTPAPGAEATTGALISPKLIEMRKNLTADMAASAAKNAPPANVNIVQAPQADAMAEAVAADKSSGSLPYSAVRALRTEVGNQIDWGFAPADPVTNGGLKKVWGALSDDLTNGASAVSPEAKQAASEANTLYAQNQAKREFLNTIVEKNGGPEAVYQAATNGTKEGATKIGGIMQALPPAQQNIVRATVLSRLGRAAPSAQNAEGSAFSPNTFLTNWGKIDPSAKDAMFGASGSPQTLRSGLDSLTDTMSTIRSGTKLRNPSGSGEVVGHGAGAIALWEGLTHAIAGHPAGLAATVGGVTANNLLARALTNPRTVNWLAQSTKAPVSVLPNAVNQLSQMGQKTNDPDVQDLASYLTPTAAPIARASGGRVDDDALVQRLVSRWKAAKKATDDTTKPLLRMPDTAIAKALEIAGRSI